MRLELLDPDNTRTPLIVWGKGARGPLPDSTPSSHDEYSRPWGLTKYLRQDVEQADIAPLMATILGVNFPVNSVGVLPAMTHLEHSYLAPKGGDATKAKSAVVNAKVILEQYRVKHRKSQLSYLNPLLTVAIIVPIQDSKLLRRLSINHSPDFMISMTLLSTPEQ